MEELVLHYKLIKGDKAHYVFSTSARSAKKVLGYEQAIKLIAGYAPENRNCRVSSGLIGLKRGMGKMPVYKDACMKTARQGPIYLYTKKEYLELIRPCVYSNEEGFNNTKQEKGFLLRHRDIIYKIDKASIVDLTRMKIETPFGIASVNELSTGCKTLLNVMFMLERSREGIVNIDECGDNVLDAIFDAAAGTSVSLYISRSTEKVNTNRRFILNGKELKDDMDFLDAIWAEDEE